MSNIFGCFLSYQSLMYDATENQKQKVKEQGDFFHSYIWKKGGIDDVLKNLKHENYGTDIKLILLQFYINPLPFELVNLKEIENYRTKEKSVGFPIIIDEDNFFKKSDKHRHLFIKNTILEKLDLLYKVVKKKNLDTDIDKLKYDLVEIWDNTHNK